MSNLFDRNHFGSPEFHELYPSRMYLKLGSRWVCDAVTKLVIEMDLLQAPLSPLLSVPHPLSRCLARFSLCQSDLHNFFRCKGNQGPDRRLRNGLCQPAAEIDK
ncbi:unnamed protein product [Protopolystoma xenopodis]|uniref:Uncharacterized protein n=1 Tax=Protopolystoma xenopodis TaxID=117903 RepID=A0A448WHI9_9PLAT|nr:unnamed protein product [Protopolystoma xenopodis]